MPTLINSERLDLEFFRSLNLYSVDYEFLHSHSEEYRSFVKRYFDANNKLPTEDSFNGYDCMMLMANLVNKGRYGKNFTEMTIELPYLGMSADFEPYRKTENDAGAFRTSQLQPIDFMVNARLNLIKFENNEFKEFPIAKEPQ
jgi:hypothetical protein